MALSDRRNETAEHVHPSAAVDGVSVYGRHDHSVNDRAVCLGSDGSRLRGKAPESVSTYRKGKVRTYKTLLRRKNQTYPSQ